LATEKTQTKYFNCDCGKRYKDKSGLWKHKHKGCVKKNALLTTEVIVELIKDNAELKNIIIEQNNTINTIVNKITTTNNITQINSHNKSFNLNLFLNETCKDAMNITEFIHSIKINIDDLENTGKRGYIEGISNIILKNLNNIEQHMRPLHCSDTKREILYVKDTNGWEKESNDKPILTKAIKYIANENIKQITNWQSQNPDCMSIDSKKNNLYLKIVSNSMNGSTDEESKKNINKIISNVAKEIVIKKIEQ
jgi:hypothetical protein